jgi:ABC-type multidrug transport system fused ATPase/permease subunit
MAVALLAGAVWIHVDYLVVVAAFAGIFLIPLLGSVFVLYLIIFIGGFVNNRARSKRQGLTGMAMVVVFMGAPFLSTWVVDKFNKYRGEALVQQIEQYRIHKGRYPANTRALNTGSKPLLLTYSYNSKTDHYSISFKNGGMITTRFDSRTRKWVDYGWDD